MSDFAPIHEKVSRKGKKSSIVDSGTREGFVFHTLRWPLLLAIFIVISLEFLLYVLVRQLVNVIEYSMPGEAPWVSYASACALPTTMRTGRKQHCTGRVSRL